MSGSSGDLQHTRQPLASVSTTSEHAQHGRSHVRAWNGQIAIDIRDAVPDRTPYEQPQAHDGAPNVLMIAWDDVGYGALDVSGGPIEVPTMCRIAGMGLHYSNYHTTALCSPEPTPVGGGP